MTQEKAEAIEEETGLSLNQVRIGMNTAPYFIRVWHQLQWDMKGGELSVKWNGQELGPYDIALIQRSGGGSHYSKNLGFAHELCHAIYNYRRSARGSRGFLAKV